MWILLLIGNFINLLALQSKVIVVDAKGQGDFVSIQAALDSVSVNQSIRRIIITEGVYPEKILIDSTINHLTIEGKKGHKVIITQSLARDIWRCEYKDDFGAATVNVKGSDLTFINLTMVNDYGRTFEDMTIDCPQDFTPVKTDSNPHSLKREVSKTCHQFAFRSMDGATRLKFYKCRFISWGGDTMSPWTVTDGLYYLEDCYIEGHVDAYCPRGSAFAVNCTFFFHNKHAGIWHDGSFDQNSKSVFLNCQFDGISGFALGRYHKDSQQYLLDCSFSESMADLPIYKVETKNIVKHGHRVYFKDCHKEGLQFEWYGDNIEIKTKEVDADWVFGNKWKI